MQNSNRNKLEVYWRREQRNMILIATKITTKGLIMRTINTSNRKWKSRREVIWKSQVFKLRLLISWNKVNKKSLKVIVKVTIKKQLKSMMNQFSQNIENQQLRLLKTNSMKKKQDWLESKRKNKEFKDV